MQYSFSQLSNLGVGAICLAETNLNWKHPRVLKHLKDTTKKIWQHSSSITSHIPEDNISENQPGGTMTLLTNNWTSRIIERGVDPFGLGRWTYMTLRGKNGIKILIVTAYRVCPQSISSIGPQTSTAQQHRLLSKSFREANRVEDPKPRLQFIVDLQSWLEHKISLNYSIILSIDANEGLQNKKGKYFPVAFSLNHPLPITGHDGSIATLITTCGLCDPLCLHHTTSPPPPTYKRGKDRIDYIFVSTGILPAVIRSGLFPYDQVFIADHRPCYIDLDSTILFQEDTPSITPPIYRGLQTLDPRLTTEYINIVNKQIQYHKLDTRIQSLEAQATTGQWHDHHIAEYEAIDRLLTEAMLSAEKQISKKVSTTYVWSPTLKQSIAALRYWQLSLKKAQGRPIPDSILVKYQEDARIDIKTIPNPLRLPEIVHRLRQTRTALYDAQRRHLDLRANHLQELADARILLKNPTALQQDSKKWDKQRKKELNRIIRKEFNKQLHRKIGYLLYPERYSGGLSSIDIPAESDQPYPLGPDPKQWEGAWKVITNPNQLATHVSAANRRQYHQAAHTPFGEEPLKTYFGHNGDTTGAEALIAGQLPPQYIMKQLLPETQTLLRYLAAAAKTSPIDSTTHISGNEFSALHKAMAEGTSSSPSGRHIGHYKVAASAAPLAQLHASMMSLPYTAGFSPTRWREVIDVMLLKKPNDHRIHRLRIVALQESDYNQSNRLLIGRPLLHKLEDNNLLPDVQYGSRPSRQCHSAILNKVLTYEIHRYQKRTLAYIENDAVGCYDRIINPLILIFLRILGLSKSLVTCLASTWEHTHHRIKTLYGISSEGYRNNLDCLLFGPGQGSTIGPLLWLLCFLLIFRSLSNSTPGITIISVDKRTRCEFIGEAFVDDAGLGSNTSQDTDEEEDSNHQLGSEPVFIMANLQKLAQEWERLLFSTGGALNLQKCFWFIMAWKWTDSRASLHTQLTLPGELLMTSGNDTSQIAIPCIEPTDSFRTLGVFLSPSGSNKGAMSILQEIVLTYASTITGTHITRKQALVSYIQYLLPKLRYQPPLLSLSPTELARLQAPTLSALLPKLNINRNTARSIIHGPEEYGGMNLPHITTTQGVDKLQLFLGHLRLQDRTAKLIHSDLSYLQLLAGVNTLCLNLPIAKYKWVEQGWLTSLWQFANFTNIQFVYPEAWLPSLTRENDCFLMPTFIQLGFPPPTLKRLNKCRLYLQALTLLDLTSADGRTILPSAKHGKILEDRPSTLLWPTQGRPTKAAWTEWAKALSMLELNGKLLQPLGRWLTSSHQAWQHFIHLPTLDVYLLNPGFVPRLFRPILRYSPRTRSQHQPWYDRYQSQSTISVPENLHPVTIVQEQALTGSLFTINHSSTPIPPPTSQAYQNQLTDEILGLTLNPPTLSTIQESLNQGDSTIICSSNYDAATARATSTCSILSATPIFEHESAPMPVDNRLRPELFSILTGLHALYTTIQAHPHPSPSTSRAIFNCNSKKALRWAFSDAPLGLKDATATNFDLLLEICRLRKLLTVPVSGIFCPVRNGGVPSSPDTARPNLLLTYSTTSTGFNITQAPPSHVITALYHGKPIITNLRKLITEEIYKLPLQLKIQQDNKWSSEQFNSIDWKLYKLALNRIPRSQRISITKLSHQLWNTNIQNQRFYGQSNLCPYCRDHPEDLDHVFTCGHSAATQARSTAFNDLKDSLRPITPPNVYDSIVDGLIQWMTNPTLPSYVAPTEGSLLPQLASLSMAFRQ